MSLTEFCPENCLEFRQRQVGGCLTCREGWVTEPECCLCDQVGNETHAFYRSEDGQQCLRKFCYVSNLHPVMFAATGAS